MARAVELLRRDDVPLLTLTGPGGVGKTRLALAIAMKVAEAFEDGVRFVPLASVQDPQLVATSIMQTLSVQDVSKRTARETLINHLRHRHLLLLLDNFEHLLSAAPLVADLLQSCPRLTLLVTSRSPLHLHDEREIHVAPLPIPVRDEAGAPVEALENPAVELFTERMRAVRPEMDLTRDTLTAIVDICTHLDGLPLAIELAAARTRLLSPRFILDRLEHRFELLTNGPLDAPERQRTLRDTIDWSYHLLDHETQSLFRRLSVFVGGWSLDLANGMAGGERDMTVIHRLGPLVDHHLISRTDLLNGELRFGMLETVREYGLALLKETGESEGVQRRHAELYADLIERLDRKLYEYPVEPVIVDRFSLEHDNVRAALRWSIDRREAALAQRLAGSMRRFWNTHGNRLEAHQWLEAACAIEGDVPLTARVWALDALGIMRRSMGDLDGARVVFEQILPMYETLGNQRRYLRILSNLAEIAIAQGDLDQASDLATSVLSVARELNDLGNISSSLQALGEIAIECGDLERAEMLLQQALSTRLELKNDWAIIVSLLSLAFCDLAQGRYDDARPRFEECERLSNVHEHRIFLSIGRIGLGWVSLAEGKIETAGKLFTSMVEATWELGEFDEMVNSTEGVASVAVHRCLDDVAVQLFAAAAGLRDAAGLTLRPSQWARFARFFDLLKERMDPGTWERQWQEGQMFSAEQVIALARTLLPHLAHAEISPPDVPMSLKGLTAREAEVLRLLSRGKSNKQIGDELFLSVRTVERHIANLYRKIDAHNRAEATAWALRHGLV